MVQSKLTAIFLELQLDQLGITHCRQLIGSTEILHPLLVGGTGVEDGHSDSLNELTVAEDKNLTACRLIFQAPQSILSPPK